MKRQVRAFGANRLLAIVSASLIFTGWAALTRAADHRDGSIQQDTPADLSDFHAFVNQNNDRVVLSLSVNGFGVPGVNIAFSTDILLQIKIDNTGDFVEDLVIQALFEGSIAGETVKVLGPAPPQRSGAENGILKHQGSNTPGRGDQCGVFTGPVDGVVRTAANGMRVFAGQTDDPTFADLIFVRSLLAGVPLGRPAGIDSVSGLNSSTMTLEIPSDMLRGSSGEIIRVWGTASRRKTSSRSARSDPRDVGPWIQIDRVGVPALNPILIPAERHDEFNRGVPSRDDRFREDIFRAVLSLDGGDEDHANDVADMLLPDVLTLDVTDLSGFPNGRRPESDWVDVFLALLSNGLVTTDGVPRNDVPLLDEFPFFAPPHGPEEPIPPRN